MPQLGFLAFLIILNAVFAGAEIALISLREGQLQRLERRSRTGRILARLARDPNRFLATIQVGITLAGFLASAFAAVTLAEPLVPALEFLGAAAEPVAILAVTALLTFITLVFGELAPKRVAMQRAERWGLLMARPLDVLSRGVRPVIWLLDHATNLVVRLMGADPGVHRDQVTEEELRDLVVTQTAFSEGQRRIISGAFEIGDRILRQVLVPRRQVFSLDAELAAPEALRLLVDSGHSRAPVIGESLDGILGVANLRSLVGAGGPLTDHVDPALEFPESLAVVNALRTMQAERQQLAVVVNEYGGVEGIVTIEDLVEELVGEIYDETDPDVLSVIREESGAALVPGSFPIHDLVDLEIEVPEGGYTTVAGLLLDRLGYLPRTPGVSLEVAGRELEVVEIEGRTIARVRIHPPSAAGHLDEV
ncbi:MAG TPA: hemolysin family protein [Acidimicrobiia bacterium]|nr:hemolysin family protein [Acidimicrobiia bacterium]